MVTFFAGLRTSVKVPLPAARPMKVATVRGAASGHSSTSISPSEVLMRALACAPEAAAGSSARQAVVPDVYGLLVQGGAGAPRAYDLLVSVSPAGAPEDSVCADPGDSPDS